MRRMAAVFVLACGACGAQGLGAGTLPEPPPRSLAEVAPRLAAGEQTVWNVFYQGVPIGRADLVVDERAARARTTFHTSGAARALKTADFELATGIEGGQVRGVREILTLGRETERAEAEIDGASYTPPDGEARGVPGGTRLHTLQSALGVMRAWSAERAPAPGYLWVWSGGELYRLDVVRPMRDDVLGVKALRVDGRVRAPQLHGEIEVQVWLAANAERTPIRLLLRSGSHVLVAEVYESTLSLEAR